MKVIHWKTEKIEDTFHAQCYEYKECIANNTDFDDLISDITNQSRSKLGSCKVLITYYFDIE